MLLKNCIWMIYHVIRLIAIGLIPLFGILVTNLGSKIFAGNHFWRLSGLNPPKMPGVEKDWVQICYCRFGQNPTPDGFMCHRLAQRSGITSAMKTYELSFWRTRTNAYMCALHIVHCTILTSSDIHIADILYCSSYFILHTLGQPFYCKNLLSLHSAGWPNPPKLASARCTNIFTPFTIAPQNPSITFCARSELE